MMHLLKINKNGDFLLNISVNNQRVIHFEHTFDEVWAPNTVGASGLLAQNMRDLGEYWPTPAPVTAATLETAMAASHFLLTTWDAKAGTRK